MSAEKKARRPPGRPKVVASLKDEKGRTILNLGSKLREDLEQEAEKQGWDLSTLARFALKSWLRARQQGYDIDTLLYIATQFDRLLDRLSEREAGSADHGNTTGGR
jgi:hypothetical protein